jgi:competence protein ComEA
VLPELLEQARASAQDQNERAKPLADGERIDPNSASDGELDRLPGVGPATARAIIEARTSEGPFRSLEDLGRVRGIGRATLAKIEKYLEFSAPPAGARVTSAPAAPAAERVDVNRADEALLQTLPGVGPALARRIVEARSEAPFRTVDELLQVSGIGPATLEKLRDRVRLGR